MRNGSIRYISMENWMAYTGPVVVHSSPGVNIIAASNGSGKSAIVCAIALSLGFDLSILSRADSITSFVKRGCLNAILKVGLADDESNEETLHIERRIFLTPLSLNETSKSAKTNSSNQDKEKKQKFSVKNEWYLNGESSTLINIKSHHKRLNIQLDNLLTFLAQANVGKFAAMTQQQLFRSTLEAINFKLVDELDYLVDLSQKLKSKAFESKLLQEQLNASNQKLSELKIMSDTLMKIKDATLYMNIVKLKLNQSKLSNIKKANETTRRRIGDTNNDIYSREIKYKKLQAKYEKIQSSTRSLLELAKNNIEKVNQIFQADNCSMTANNMNDSGLNEPVQKAFYDSLTMINSFSNEVQRFESTRQISEDSEQSLREKIESLDEEINSLKSKLSNDDELVSSIAANKIKEDSIRYNLRKFQSKRDYDPRALQYEALLKNLSYTKRDMIIRYNRLCEAKSTEPKKFIVNDIKVSGKLNCAIVENLIWSYLDCVLLHSSEVDDNLKLIKDFKLPTVTAPEKNNVMCQVTEKMKSYGVVRFVHELINASEPTIQVLSSLCDINEAFIIDEKLYNRVFLADKNKANSENLFSEFYKTMLEEISRQTGARVSEIKYFVGNKKHIHKHFYKSNYFMDTEMEISKDPRVIVDFGNYGNDSRNEEMVRLENELDEVRSILYDLNKKLKEQNELNGNVTRKIYGFTRQKISLERSLKAIITSDNQSLSGRNWKQDLQKLKKKRLNQITKSIISTANTLKIRIQNAGEVRNILIEAGESYDEYCSKVVNNDEMNKNLENSRKELDDLKSTLSLLQNTFEEQKEMIERYKSTINEVKEAIKNAEQLFDSDLFEESTNNFNDVKKQFENKLTNLTDSELEKELIKAEEQVKKLETDDFEEIQLVKMIQDERTQKDKIKQSLYENRIEVSNSNVQMNERYALWESSVKQLVEEIDYKFGQYMMYIGDGSGGQVRLDVDMDNIKEAKMRILVKFDREKDLLPLTTSYQSGGERGVTTMVYILSVQNLTNNPFFVIDEINQGLDSHYERNLMKLLLASSENNKEFSQGKSTPQYFILTPQLISGYDLSKATLHFPLNGPGIEQNIELSN